MKLSYELGIVVFILALSFQMQCQDLDYIPGEVIIQVQPDLVDNRRALSINSSFKESYTIEKNLFPDLGIYLVTYDPARDFESVRRELAEEEDILYIQKNQKLSPRETTPNDPFFLDQWYHKTIDSELAWDITTGGVDSEGREIVIAVMDSGFDTNHQDFQGNIWANLDEIPDDGIDNDNNGFIDDYYGWNFDDNSDDHGIGQGTVHGSNVAGMAAARGDNGEGISGVTWDAKLMFLSGLKTSTEIIESMRYASGARKKFNETNGAEGAYIVVSNISLGIRNGLAVDYPIWCNLYDVLGQNGVLNVCAVDNLNSDVEQNGDMPTTCDSEYLITVTNTDINNQIDPSAAFGSVSVDIGAPGTGNITTSPNNNYLETTGTSVSAPLVAGAVALLYSAPCDNIAERSTSNPESTTLTMKNMIFNGARATASLQGITTQGAVLNVYESLKALEKTCGSGAGDGQENSISISPNIISKENPSLFIEYKAQGANGDPLLMMFDAKGSLVFEQKLSETFFGVNAVSVDLSNQTSSTSDFYTQLSSGVYFVSLILPNKDVVTEKLVIY